MLLPRCPLCEADLDEKRVFLQLMSITANILIVSKSATTSIGDLRQMCAANLESELEV